VDSMTNYRRIIEKVLENHTQISYANGEIENEIIFDQANDRYLVMSVGWDDVKRIHGCLLHIDIILRTEPLMNWSRRAFRKIALCWDFMSLMSGSTRDMQWHNPRISENIQCRTNFQFVSDTIHQ